MKPSIGRIVHYKTRENEVFPAIIVRVWSDICVNLHIFTDISATPTLLETSRLYNEELVTDSWCWPPRV